MPTSSWRSTFALCLISSLTTSLLPCSACTMRGVVPSPLLSSTLAPFLTSFCTISAVVHLNSPRLLSLAWKKTLTTQNSLSLILPPSLLPIILFSSLFLSSLYFVWWNVNNCSDTGGIYTVAVILEENQLPREFGVSLAFSECPSLPFCFHSSFLTLPPLSPHSLPFPSLSVQLQDTMVYKASAEMFWVCTLPSYLPG